MKLKQSGDETAALLRREERLNELLREIDDWLRRHDDAKRPLSPGKI